MKYFFTQIVWNIKFYKMKKRFLKMIWNSQKIEVKSNQKKHV